MINCIIVNIFFENHYAMVHGCTMAVDFSHPGLKPRAMIERKRCAPMGHG